MDVQDPRLDRSALEQRRQAAEEALRRQTERLRAAIEACRATASTIATPLPGTRLFARDSVRIGEVEVVLPRQEVRHAGGAQRLTPTEWQLLTFLLANPGAVHSRVDMAVGAWGHGFAERHSEVEVYVSRLRRKLGPAAGCLETVRGLGYRLVLGDATTALAGVRQRLGKAPAFTEAPEGIA